MFKKVENVLEAMGLIVMLADIAASIYLAVTLANGEILSGVLLIAAGIILGVTSAAVLQGLAELVGHTKKQNARVSYILDKLYEMEPGTTDREQR